MGTEWKFLHASHGESVPEHWTAEQIREAFEKHLARSVSMGGGRTILFLASLGAEQPQPCRPADPMLMPANCLDILNALQMAVDAIARSGALNYEGREIYLEGFAQALGIQILRTRPRGVVT